MFYNKRDNSLGLESSRKTTEIGSQVFPGSVTVELQAGQVQGLNLSQNPPCSIVLHLPLLASFLGRLFLCGGFENPQYLRFPSFT